MKELILRYGYTYTGNCNCEGFSTEKYINGDYLLRLRVKKEMFRIKHKGRSLTQWIPQGKLQETLSNIHNTVNV